MQLSRILTPEGGFDGQLSYPEYCRLQFESQTPEFKCVGHANCVANLKRLVICIHSLDTEPHIWAFCAHAPRSMAYSELPRLRQKVWIYSKVPSSGL